MAGLTSVSPKGASATCRLKKVNTMIKLVRTKISFMTVIQFALLWRNYVITNPKFLRSGEGYTCMLQ